MKRRVEIRVTVFLSVCASSNLIKNLNIVMKLGTHISWYRKTLILKMGEIRPLPLPQNAIIQKQINCHN